MRNDEAGLLLENRPESLQNLGFGLRVDTGKTIVENENRWIHDQSTRQCRPLFLPPGERDAAFTDDGIHSLGKDLQITIQLGDPHGPRQFFIGDFVPAKGQIAPQGGRKEKWVLGNITESPAQLAEGKLSNILSVHENFAGGHIE